MPSVSKPQHSFGLDPVYTASLISSLLDQGKTDYAAAVSCFLSPPPLANRQLMNTQERRIEYTRSHATDACVSCISARKPCNKTLPRCAACVHNGEECDYATHGAQLLSVVRTMVNYVPSVDRPEQDHEQEKEKCDAEANAVASLSKDKERDGDHDADSNAVKNSNSEQEQNLNYDIDPVLLEQVRCGSEF
jgi:hypothetical protein